MGLGEDVEKTGLELEYRGFGWSMGKTGKLELMIALCCTTVTGLSWQWASGHGTFVPLELSSRMARLSSTT